MAIEKVFPEVLRDPILRKVQFSEVGRLDDLGMFSQDAEDMTELTVCSIASLR